LCYIGCPFFSAILSCLPIPTYILIDSNFFAIGDRTGCTEEGEIIPASKINIPDSDLACFTCICKVSPQNYPEQLVGAFKQYVAYMGPELMIQGAFYEELTWDVSTYFRHLSQFFLFQNGFVECLPQRCTSQDGCYMLEQTKREGECCLRCKGCFHDGLHRRSGEEWRDPSDPCLLYTCQAGVITKAKEVCYDAHCRHTLPKKGTCCPSCKGTFVTFPHKFIFTESIVIEILCFFVSPSGVSKCVSQP